ncbi:ADP-ribosylglycohydrolase family protein [bacterium]|nr:ADP-ribosylglycohydrolase family protein [bacterium]
MNADRITGCLLGTAIGDALGLPYEGLSAQRAGRMWGVPDRYRFLCGRGMVSDDTEHSIMVARAWIATGGKEPEFQWHLARQLRWWLLRLPAGVGLATARAVINLWLGWPPSRSGVFSAGNGPAMRSAILGVVCEDVAHLQNLVHSSSIITHTDPRADQGAYLVALAAHHAARSEMMISRFLKDVEQHFATAPEWLRVIDDAATSAARGESPTEFAATIGCQSGVSGYVLHTVPVALQAWMCHSHDYAAAVQEVIACGGDTDSTAAIAGGLVGTTVGRAGLPHAWLNQLCEWPGTVRWMEALGQQLSDTIGNSEPQRPLSLSMLGILSRNALFLAVVLAHGFRRLLPPY